MDGRHRQSRDNLSGGRKSPSVLSASIVPGGGGGFSGEINSSGSLYSGLGVLVCLCRDMKYYGLSNEY